jgi:protein TonB
LGSWRYECPRSSRRITTFAAITSALLHGSIFFDFDRREHRPVAAEEEHVIAIVPFVEIKELEEPEPLPTDEQEAPLDAGAYVPMQQDLPQMPQPADFVQQINFSSLLEQPDLSQVKLLAIPETRATGRIGEKLGKIFDLSELDRAPEPLVQPAPIYPVSLRREHLQATVQVEFIVNADGFVVNAVAVQSTHSGFAAAAVSGVSRWKFRPGMKGGRKVNTRMSVPIMFRVVDSN